MQNVGVHAEWRLIVLVVFFCGGAGISTSFWQTAEVTSSIILAIVSSILVGLVFSASKYRLFKSLYLALFSLFLLGVMVGQFRLLTLEQAEVDKPYYADVTGMVERLDIREGRASRLIVKPIEINGRIDNLPKLIRISARTEIEVNVRSGSVVTFAAELSSPNGPIVPGGYNFAKAAFFEGVQAEGIAMSGVAPIANMVVATSSPSQKILKIREAVEEVLLENISGQAGAVSVALTVGFRNHLTSETTEALRRAGLSHLLAISGLHMGLVTAAAFVVFEFLFACFPRVGLRIMPKKLAVLPTWGVAITYLFLSGASTSTIRAFIMVSVALLAVAVDRRVVSLRSVAIAAFLIVFLKPESVWSVGFQMSFAATAGLVAFYERFASDISRWRERAPTIGHRLMLYIAATALTSIIAQFAIAPISLYHFQTLSLIGIFANVLVLPIVSLIVMPLLFLGVMTAQFGGLSVVSFLIDYSLQYVLAVALGASDFPYAVFQTLPIADTSFILAIAAFITLLVIRHMQVGLILCAIGTAVLVFGTKAPADVLVSNSGKTVSVFSGDKVYSTGGRSRSFREKVWRQYWAQPPGESLRLARICGNSGCSYDVSLNKAHTLTRMETLVGVRYACAKGKVVILPRKYLRYCKGALLSISSEELKARGPLALYLNGNSKPRIEWSLPVKRELP